MFKFMQSPAYWWPATIKIPAEDDPGKMLVLSFEVQFKRETATEQQTRLDANRAAQQSDATYVRPLIVGFRKLLADDDTEVPFNADSLTELLDVPGAGTALARAYFESNSEAAAKN